MRAALFLLALAAPAAAQAPAPDATSRVAAADLRAKVDAMDGAMKPGQGFAWAALVQADGSVAGLEIWKKPGKPAIHPTDAEYTIVIDGHGTMVTGGTMLDPVVVNPGQTDGSRIAGGTTRPLAPGDVVLIPAGTPHWFGVTGPRLVLLGMKLPRH